jgi:methyl-accepting chemotaxis protein
VSWLKNLKTATKLVLGFGAMVILLFAAIFAADRTITAIRDSQQSLFEREFMEVMALMDLRADLDRQRAQMLELTLTGERNRQEILAGNIRSQAREIDDFLQRLHAAYQSDRSFMARLDELKATLAAFRETRDGAIRLALEGSGDLARQSVTGVQAQRFEKIRDIALELERTVLSNARAQIAASEKLAAQSLGAFAIVGGLALLLGIVMTFALTRLIAVPLVEIAGLAQRMADGDLTAIPVPERRGDEVGLLGRNFSRMSENLREQIRGLVEGANVLGSAAGEIVASTAQLASSASESAAAVSETTTTVEEVRQTAQVASQKSRQVSESAQKVAQVSLGGRKSVEDVVAGMGRIRGQMEAIAASMARLSEQGQAIGQIIAVVEDLAAQSNLLAVNAAIEAAKAGEQGKGFGVVAQEVRSLAEQSRQATAQVRAILADIQKATAAAVMATEQGVKAVEAGVRQSEVAGEAIQALAGSVAEAAQAATQIAASSQQQLVGMEQVAAAMDNIKQASAQNVASAQQLESAARNLNELGQRLKQMVERYRV